MNNRLLGILIVLLLLSLLPYLNILQNEFVFDDLGVIVDNPKIRSLENIKGFFTESFRAHFTGRHYKDYRPLTIISFAINYYFGKVNPFGYHIINILIHSINAILVYFLSIAVFNLVKNHDNYPDNASKKQGKNIYSFTTYIYASFSSLIFAVHPIHTEVVTGVIGRSDIITCSFFLAALLLHIKNLEVFGLTNVTLTSLTLLSYLAALLSKEMGVTLPMIIFLYDYFRRPSLTNWKRLKYYMLFAIPILLYIILRFNALGTFGQDKSFYVFKGVDYLTRLLTMSTIFTDYIRILFLPINLNADYTMIFYPIINIKVIALLIVFLSIYRAKKGLLLFSIAWFFITLLPVSNIIPIGALAAERFLYISSISFSFVVANFFMILLARNKGILKILHYIVILSFLFIINGFSINTVVRNYVWKDHYSLWIDTVKKSPTNPRAHNNMGAVYKLKKMYTKAGTEYLKAIELHSNYYIAIEHMGYVLVNIGIYNKAIEFFTDLINKPEYDEIGRLNIGIASYKNGDFDTAISYLNRNYKDVKLMEDACYNLGLLYMKKGMLKRAVYSNRQLITLNPARTSGYLNLGTAYSNMGLFYLAIETYKDIPGVLNNNDRWIFLNNLGASYAAIGDRENALFYYKQVLKEYPDHEDIYITLADIYYKLFNDWDKAVFVLRDGIKNYSSFKRLYSKLQELYVTQKMQLNQL